MVSVPPRRPTGGSSSPSPGRSFTSADPERQREVDSPRAPEERAEPQKTPAGSTRGSASRAPATRPWATRNNDDEGGSGRPSRWGG